MKRRFTSILAGARKSAKRFCAEITRDVSTPGDVEDWDVEETYTSTPRTEFHTLKALAWDTDVSGVIWGRVANDATGNYAQTDWEMCDDEGRNCRDYMVAERCSGDPLTFPEARRLDRLLDVREDWQNPLEASDRARYEEDRKERMFTRRHMRQRFLP